MDAKALFLNAYKRYWDEADTGSVDPPCAFVDYPVRETRGDDSPRSLTYGLIEDEFTRELANTINQLASTAHTLAIWERVLNEYPEDEARLLRFEFTRLPLYFCLLQPAEFRSRLIFCATHLCHQANLAAKRGTEEDLPDDHKIELRTYEGVSQGWEAASSVPRAVSEIDDLAFRQATRFFRNKAQHRIAPGLEVGLTETITRKRHSSRATSYAFHALSPLTTGRILPLLADQAGRMIRGFEAYRALVREHYASALRGST